MYIRIPIPGFQKLPVFTSQQYFSSRQQSIG
jgi:hypothetical protein